MDAQKIADLEEAELDAFLAALARRRRELDPSAPAVPGRRMDANVAPLPAGVALAAPPAGSGARCARCSAPLPRPGICDACGRVLAEGEHAARLARWLRTIPGRYRDVSWDALPTLRREDGAPRVTLSPGKSLASLRGLLCRAHRIVLLGPAGSGKSTIAMAVLRERWEAADRDLAQAQARLASAHASRAGRSLPLPRLRERTHRFMISAELREPERRADDRRVHPLELALGADVLVLDELGAELEGAQPGSGLLAQRVGPGSAAVGLRFDRGRDTIITTGLDRAAMTALYGDRVARRAFEGAVVIRLGSAS
jgi:hypothetical protein